MPDHAARIVHEEAGAAAMRDEQSWLSHSIPSIRCVGQIRNSDNPLG
jgi:hypothetical protein